MSNNDCPICQYPINKYNCVVFGRCGHMLCTNCWNEFKENHIKMNGSKSPKCPSCRSLIHISSVLYGDALNYVRDKIEYDIKIENKYLRDLLFKVSDLNRKDIGIWKYQYKKFVQDGSILYDQYTKIKIEIEQEYYNGLVKYRSDLNNFLYLFNSMRKNLKRMTKKYIEIPRPKIPMPPDPVDEITPELLRSISDQANEQSTQSFPFNINFLQSQSSSPNISSRAVMIGSLPFVLPQALNPVEQSTSSGVT